MTKRVFIGSTGADLAAYRQAAITTCNELGLMPVAMEHFEAMGQGATAGSLAKLNGAQVYVGIFAHRYGYIEDGYDKSVTELEFDHAGTRGLPRLCFLVDPKHPWPPDTWDHEHYAQLQAFKSRINKLIRAQFSTVDHFRVELYKALRAYADAGPTLALRALHQIPAPPADFTGRTVELDALLAHLKQPNLPLLAVQGMGGIGKTTLALELAQRIGPDYPDGQFFVDLRGAEATPLSPEAAQAHVIRAYRPTERLPDDPAQIEALFRSVLHEQRTLLLMDNARDADQVRPLIPPPGSVLLVTSRQHFTLPGLYAWPLEALPPDQAHELLLKIAPRLDAPVAAEGEPEKAYEALARLCGWLPLALRISASALAERRDLDVAEYLTRLGRAQERLALVNASLSLSYDLLEPALQSHWRTLAVFPESFDRAAAAALWELDEEPTAAVLGPLLRYSLLEWEAGRYRLHDLARVYAQARLDETERESGQRRHAQHYLTVLKRANVLYFQGGVALAEGLGLFDLEWGNIQAGQAWAAARAEEETVATQLCNYYGDLGAYCLNLRQHPRERIGWLEAGLGAARRLQDRQGEGIHLGNLGTAYADLGKTRRAIDFYEQALVIVREIGDRRGEGNALNNLGVAHKNLGKTRQAINYYEQSLTLLREIGDRRGEGSTLGNLGNAYSALGETRRAIDFYEQQLTIVREIGDRRGEGNALFNTALALDELGQRDQAIIHVEAALRLFEAIEAPAAATARQQLADWQAPKPPD